MRKEKGNQQRKCQKCQKLDVHAVQRTKKYNWIHAGITLCLIVRKKYKYVIKVRLKIIRYSNRNYEILSQNNEIVNPNSEMVTLL